MAAPGSGADGRVIKNGNKAVTKLLKNFPPPVKKQEQ